MKILHTADWHLGIALHKQSLMEDQYDFIKQLKQIVMDENNRCDQSLQEIFTIRQSRRRRQWKYLTI